MTSNVALDRDEPPQGISPADAETVIRTLGASLIAAYNDAYTKACAAEGEPIRSAWDSKQREHLLRALIERVALHARTLENAALSATDTAIATFASKEFKKGNTRSQRDRAPITKNIDKVIGRWLRRLGRLLKQNEVDAPMTGDVELRGGRKTFRVTFTFAYPRRLAERRLRISARLEERLPGGGFRSVPLRADPDAKMVALPETRRRYQPAEAQLLRHMFATMKSMAELHGDDELAAHADRGERIIMQWSAAKIVLAVILTLVVSTAASPQGRRFVKRIVDAITSSSSLPELLRKLRVDADDALFVTPGGTRAPVARSGSGSEVRLSPGASPDLLHIQSSVRGKDRSEFAALTVPLGEVGRVGVNAFQYRSAPHEPIVPWVVEVAVIPEQDAELAAELARETASVSITYDPPLQQADVTRVGTVSLSGKRGTLVTELRELPHEERTYAIAATVRRGAGSVQVYRAQLRVDRKGFATLQRDRGLAVTSVPQDVKVGHPICTTILHEQSLPMFIPGQMDYVWALAKLDKEQEAILFVYPPSSGPTPAPPEEITVDWGDGSKANHEVDEGVFTATHAYRVGDRAYPITIYFKGSDVVYQFDLYVFRTRAPGQTATAVDYITPYPPNPELTSLAEANWNEPGVSYLLRQGPVTTESITYSRHHDPWVWSVSMSRTTDRRVKFRYVWRDGEVVEVPEQHVRQRER
jgi:hypothetical protein